MAAARAGGGETRDEVSLDNLDAMSDRFIPVLRDRPLSVMRVLRGRAPFMQKNLSSYAPDWIPRVTLWAESSRREVAYPLCNDRRTLLWLANQRSVEYHPTLVRGDRWDRPTHLILDLDPPSADEFARCVAAAVLVRQVLVDGGVASAVKTSGSKGVHIYVPLDDSSSMEDVAAATRAIAVRAERLDPALAT